MTAEVLLQHLRELGVIVELSSDARGLVVDAPAGVMMRELADCVRKCREVLIELVYVTEERAAIMNESTEWIEGKRAPKARDDAAADERLAQYLKREDKRKVVGGVPMWEPQHLANF